MKPISVDEILARSEITFDMEAPNLELKRADGDKSYAIGYFKKGTKTRHGIARCVGKDGQIQEGLYVEDKLNGFGRVCFKSGDHYAGLYKEGKKHGQGRYIFKNGKKLDGMWDEDMF